MCGLLFAIVPFDPDTHIFREGFITVSIQEVDFGQVEIPGSSQQVITIFNGGSDELLLLTAEYPQSEFLAAGVPESLSTGSSSSFQILFSPEHNISYLSFLILRYGDTDQDIFIRLEGTGDYPGTYYDSTSGLWGESLKAELHEIINPHIDLGYSGGRRTMYGIIDNENNTLECVYTGFTQYWPYGDDGTFPDPINCEHTWPQTFFNSSNPMRGDIFHLYPTHMDANSARGSYPFGNAVSGINWSDGGSLRGQNIYGETVFEPRDAHKGDAARSIFYFVICYGNLGGYLGENEETDLREWYLADPVSQKEIDRNNAIFEYQENRNPFIDHPEFLSRISSFTGTSDGQPELPGTVWVPDGVELGQLQPDFFFHIGNSSQTALIIQDAVLAFNAFSAEIQSQLVMPGEWGTVQISLSGTEPGYYQDILTVHTSDPNAESVNIAVSAMIWAMGDLNQDNALDVVDVIILVDVILNQPEPEPLTAFLSDIVPDGSIDILDAVGLVGLILE